MLLHSKCIQECFLRLVQEQTHQCSIFALCCVIVWLIYHARRRSPCLIIADVPPFKMRSTINQSALHLLQEQTCISSHPNVIINAFFSCSSDSLNNDAQDGPTPPLCTWKCPYTVLMHRMQFACLMRSDACTLSVVSFSLSLLQGSRGCLTRLKILQSTSLICHQHSFAKRKRLRCCVIISTTNSFLINHAKRW